MLYFLMVIVMYTLLLVIIYFAFISLGLPDSLLGSAWPTMHLTFNVPTSYMGIVTMIISGCTIISSLFSDKLNKKLGTAWVTAGSTLLTVLALFGFSFSTSFLAICLIAIPYGLGAGAIDASLNNYVALHYKSNHMSWLHCFWGVGTIISPYLMSYALTSKNSWPMGYRYVAYIQLGITVILFLTIPLWKKANPEKKEEKEEEIKVLSFQEKLHLKGIIFLLFSFFAYCALEASAGQWASTFLVEIKGIEKEKAAAYASYFYIGITVGRFLSGFISPKLKDKGMIYLGTCFIFIGLLVLMLVPNATISAISFSIIGLGCAPIYPSIIHATPTLFGKEASQGVIGLEMAGAYVGSTFIPPLFGLLGQHISFKILPYFLLILFAFFLIMITLLFKKTNPSKKESTNM